MPNDPNLSGVSEPPLSPEYDAALQAIEALEVTTADLDAPKPIVEVKPVVAPVVVPLAPAPVPTPAPVVEAKPVVAPVVVAPPTPPPAPAPPIPKPQPKPVIVNPATAVHQAVQPSVKQPAEIRKPVVAPIVEPPKPRRPATPSEAIAEELAHAPVIDPEDALFQPFPKRKFSFALFPLIAVKLRHIFYQRWV